MGSRLADAIRMNMPQLELRENEPLARHTSFRIGGPAQTALFPHSAEETEQLCRLLRRLGEKPLILGNGSNVLAPDEGIDGAVVFTVKAGKISREGTVITAESGAALTKCAMLALSEGLAGMEFAYGIPGTVGGALVMNAGAYGGEIKDIVARTEFLDGELMPRQYRGEEHGFGYRSSAFTGDDVILRSYFELKDGDGEEIRLRMDELMQRRKTSQPLELPSAGSAFKRPQNGYAAAMIEQCGLKGYSVGGAAVSEKHSGFIVNNGGATARDVMALMDHVRETVYAATGVELQPEIKILKK